MKNDTLMIHPHNNTPSSVRGRFAPSPTGFVHIGSLRVALYNYLFVKQQQGSVVLRIEDTDQKRFVAGSIENLLRVFRLLGIEHDEGPFLQETPSISLVEKGEYGPYIQSKRLELYHKYAQQLIKENNAYYCFCSPERLDAMRKDQVARKQMPKYDRVCCQLSPEEIQQQITLKNPHTTIRFRLPDNETVTIDDMVRGKVSFHTQSMSDAVLLKADGYPTYHLAMAVDDHLMHITHVIRGEEWLPSLPLHILIYRAFGWDAPQFAHLPLILNPDKSKLSKRQGDVAVETYMEQGYLPEALLNFSALLGWNPGDGETKEIFSLEELLKTFTITRVHKSGAVFDRKKLDWINAQHIKQLTIDDLYTRSIPFFEKKPWYTTISAHYREKSHIIKVLTIEQERLAKLNEVGEQDRFFFEDVCAYEVDMLRWKNNSNKETLHALNQAHTVLSALQEANWSREELSAILLQEAGEKRGDFLWPLRAALTGVKQSPSPFDVAWVLGKTESIRRIENAIEKLAAISVV